MTQRESPYPPEIAIPPLLGRAGVFQQRKTFQFFAQLVDENGVVQLPDQTTIDAGVGWYNAYLPQTPGECGDGLAPRDHKCERLWRISTASASIYRNNANQALTPLTPQQFSAAEATPTRPFTAAVTALGNGAVMGGNGWFRLWVLANDNTGARRFFMDLDESLEIYAFDVKVLIVGPVNAIYVPDAATIEAAARGTVLDMRVGGAIMPIESPTGLRETRFTELVQVDQGAAFQLPLPRFARRVKIFQSTTGAATGPWLRQGGATTSAFNLGQINFVNRVSTDSDAELGRESFLQSDVDNNATRIFVVQWTIAP